jgi:hypothetical protein
MSPASNHNITALLSILKPSIADNLAADINQRIRSKASAEQFINNLSATNYANNAMELYRILPSAIGSNNPPEIKMAILDSLNPAIIRSTEGLLQNPLNQSTAKAISLGQSLVRRLFEGYKLVIYQLGGELPANPKQTSKGGHLAQCILAACHLLARIQLNSFSHYLQQPSFYWRELHALYLLAEQLGVASKNMPDNLGINSSIKKVYIKLLLFSSTRPHHFSNYELRFVYSELEFWSSLAELHRGNAQGLFAVDPSTNHGTVYAHKGDNHQGHIILDTSHLVAFLKDIIRDNSDRLFSDRASRRVIGDLIKQWGEKLKRRETHIKDQAQLSVTQGFTATLCMLSKTDSFDNFLRLCGQQPPTKNNQGSSIKRIDDVWGTAFENLDSHPDDPVIYMPIGTKNSRLKVIQALRKDVSLNGACIELNDKKAQLQPGELIAVRTREANKWMAGIVRWKNISPALYSICGVQFPARHCGPAAIRIKPRGPNSEYQFMQAILLSQKRDLSEGVTLLCPPLRYTKNAKIFVLTPLQQSSAIIEEELETTEHLSHFKIVFC